MSDLLLTVNGYPNGVDNTQRRQILNGIAAIAGGTVYAADGLPFTWEFEDASGGAFVPDFQTATPVWVEFHSLAGGTYQYLYDPTHGTLRIYQAGVELAAGAAIAADTIGFRAEFVRGV